MVKPPRVIGLVLCKRMGVDTITGELSLVGVFHSLAVARWPSPPQRFTVYTALHGGQGEGTMELVVNRLETEEDVHRFVRWYAIPDPQLTVHLELPIRRCIFPAPGRYDLVLRFDGQGLTRRTLDVYPKRTRP
jgi:hypothetical protein